MSPSLVMTTLGRVVVVVPALDRLVPVMGLPSRVMPGTGWLTAGLTTIRPQSPSSERGCRGSRSLAGRLGQNSRSYTGRPVSSCRNSSSGSTSRLRTVGSVQALGSWKSDARTRRVSGCGSRGYAFVVAIRPADLSPELREALERARALAEADGGLHPGQGLVWVAAPASGAREAGRDPSRRDLRRDLRPGRRRGDRGRPRARLTSYRLARAQAARCTTFGLRRSTSGSSPSPRSSSTRT